MMGEYKLKLLEMIVFWLTAQTALRTLNLQLILITAADRQHIDH